MIRVNIVVEGQTEEAFAAKILLPYFAERNILLNTRRVETGRKKGKIFRGGVDNYVKIRNDIVRWIGEDQSAWVTTMLDLYALPQNFPGLGKISAIIDPYKKIANVEGAFEKDISYDKFIPYIQLHEFESILLAEPMKIMQYFIEDRRACEKLHKLVQDFQSPEHINYTPDKAPSKRIIEEIPAFKGLKSTAGPIIAEAIGIETIMQKCRHFADWVNKICEIKNRS